MSAPHTTNQANSADSTATTLPQTNDQSQSSTTFWGLLGLTILGWFGWKKRRSTK
ncbi:LPXTG cell wall anchor domain-containing protein [Secundilactobacillus similis]|uniref:LPXTG cell wall anchor domain-containing protein n=1 Tax=Secundilactobacillus similis TaxID=414682 RepID=UPI000ABA8EDD